MSGEIAQVNFNAAPEWARHLSFPVTMSVNSSSRNP
jgi:hypothetical protein